MIWIDALCINEYDNEEKGMQVAIMKDIFKNARKMHFQLGEAPF